MCMSLTLLTFISISQVLNQETLQFHMLFVRKNMKINIQSWVIIQKLKTKILNHKERERERERERQ